MNDYTKGILTGASLILCFFMFVSAKSQSKNLGDVTVDSITVLNADGNWAVRLRSSNNSAGGYLSTYNKHGIETAYLGTNLLNDGVAFLRDLYGDVGWEVSGKK